MATKKRRRRRTSVRRISEPARHTRKRRVRRHRSMREPGRKYFLSEWLSTPLIMDSGSAMLSGALGGGALYLIEKIAFNDATKPGVRIGTHVGATLITGFLLKMKNMAAGMAGFTTGVLINELVMKPTAMKENGRRQNQLAAAYLQQAASLPAILDEAGNPVQMGEGDIVLQETGIPGYYSQY